MKCSLCYAPTEYRKEQNADRHTHIWICTESCPFVAFEYLDNSDIEALTQSLNGNE